MTPLARAAMLVALAGACVAFLACEKETHRAARREFQALMARGLPPAEQAQALEDFVTRFPEPKTNPYLARALTLLAEHHARSGQPDIAASWYERAALANPDDPDLLNALGYFYARNGLNLDRAVSVLETAARLAQERGYPPRRQGFIKDSLGWAHRMRGDLPQAVALLEEALRLAPDAPILREHLADAYRALGENEKAVSIYLDLYLEGRATDARLKQSLDDIGRDGGQARARAIASRVDAGLRRMAERDRQEAEADGATLVLLTAPDGFRLAGSLFTPGGGERKGSASARRDGPQANGGAVLLLHGLGSNRRAAAAQGRAIAERGLVALALDLRGHGASVSEALSGSHQFAEHLGENLKGAEGDARAALAFLARQPRVDRGRLAVVGAGLGALIAARTLEAGASPSPAALVILSPWSRAGSYRPLLARLDPQAILLAAGSEESASSTVESLAAALGPPKVWTVTVPGPGGGFDLMSRDPSLEEQVASFLVRRLR